MKMKNKILGILIALVVIIGVMASQVNAATVNASATEIEKGQEVTVTVNLDNDAHAVQFVLNYDANNFEYVDGSVSSSIGAGAISINSSEAGVIRLAASSTSTSTKAVSFTFVAKENTEGTTFTASDLLTENGDTLTSDSVTVAVVEPTTEEPTNPENPGEVETPNTDTNTPADTTVNKDNGSETKTDAQKVDENGKVITKLPQTGTSIVTVAGIVAVVAIVGAIAVRKLRK